MVYPITGFELCYGLYALLLTGIGVPCLLYGDGYAGARMAQIIRQWLQKREAA